MKKLFVIILFMLVFISNLCLASPFIVCNPDDTVYKYRVRLSSDNGTTWTEWVESNPLNNAMHYDIGALTPGTYKGEAQAGGLYELTDSADGAITSVMYWSESAFFILKIKPSGKPTILKIEK